jgi:hypothetical protein
MNEQQYLIWLKGFSEGINKTPSATQWNIILEKLNKAYIRAIPSEAHIQNQPVCVSGVITGNYLGHRNGYGMISG